MELRPVAMPFSNERIGIIDIGSNSIRLVVFERLARAPVQIFNEKVLCALGRDVESTGRLNPDGVNLALANLPRFRRLAEGMCVGRLDVVATAAVRDAADGAAFVEAARVRCGMDVRILSGEEEARLSALGVVSGAPGADGAMGDLGGGSLELVGLDQGSICGQATMPLGPFRLMEASPSDASRTIQNHLRRLDWLPGQGGRSFYPVGGSWRALAKLHMEQVGYPLHVIHQYGVDARDMQEFVRLIARQSRSSLAGMADLSRRRLDVLPYAAQVLDAVLDVLRPERVVFSAFGLREGLVFDHLGADERQQDPLLDACAAFARRIDRFGHAEVLSAWTGPLFAGETPAQTRLRKAACLLSDICWAEHPDYRAPHAFLRVLRMPYPAVDHGERAFLALAVLARYTGKLSDPVAEQTRALVGQEEQQRCLALGLALRLAHTLTGGAMELLRRTSLIHTGGQIVLTLPADEEMLMGDAVAKRLDALGKALGLKPEVRTASPPQAAPALFA